ncbi:hypothetical protein P22_2642 [Propionispora sp. 2/2-37]|uniref:helix-turn-helix domain-containing protein n=1 Tax=Propionispora sp. 2/2-37 TaxID=1677858 RepID=UPI0006BB8FE1|nr:helix-turn-helix transcriptional regulator [Propionispora sp. 2/2-37]CUH96552.1 hypothetical protein P22_2642 [Propionispora sp. 2/2-37]
MYDFGMRLRKLREDKKLTQIQVAKRLNLHKSSIYGYENNIRTPSLEVLSQLALFYGVTTDYLLGHENRRIICVDGLTERQMEIINILLLEFKQGKA